MRIHLQDAVVDAISVEPTGVPQNGVRPIGRVSGPEEALPIIFTLDAIGWTELLYTANGVRDRKASDWDDVGFNYPSDISEPDEEPFDGVEVHNPIFEVIVSEKAFDRLMARFFRVLVIGAGAARDPVITTDWWPSFLTIVKDLEKRGGS
ncbi:MAG: hypothetical protein QOG45_523 [Chloroflexota bacterium]|nr:hypothetical protein [Chloroflexota bacterium]